MAPKISLLRHILFFALATEVFGADTLRLEEFDLNGRKIELKYFIVELSRHTIQKEGQQ